MSESADAEPMVDGTMEARIAPEPTEEEAAAIVAALQAGLPSGADASEPQEPSRWRFSGRWWSKPVPARRRRPF